MGLELKNVTKKFKTIEGERVIFENLNIHFPDYGLIAITGESGCGKSTLLQLIAGLDQDYEGKILFNQVKIEDIKHNLVFERIQNKTRNEKLEKRYLKALEILKNN